MLFEPTKKKRKIRQKEGDFGPQALENHDPPPSLPLTLALSLSPPLTSNHWPTSGVTAIRHASPARGGSH